MVENATLSQIESAWKKDRKNEWKYIVKNLRVMKGHVDIKAHKYHKELFFDGTIHSDVYSKEPSIRSKMISMNVFHGNLLFFKMWYHPEPSLEVFRELIRADEHELTQSRRIAIEDTRRFFFNSTYRANDFPTEYGWAGGREELIANSLIFGFDFDDKIRVDKGARGEVSCSLTPFRIVSLVVSGLAMLMVGQKGNPYYPGRYLWDHFDYVYKNKLQYLKKEDYLWQEKKLELGLYRLLNLDNIEMESFRRIHAMNLKNYLVERFEANDFCPKLQSYWTEAKSRYEAGEVPE